MKIVSIIGARPQFVKEAIVQKAIEKNGHEEILIHTGQHFDQNMSGVFFDVLKMRRPDMNLAINSGSHGENTGRMIIELERILLAQKPDVVLLYGDTDSTLAGAIAASKLDVKVCHVEAGLRQEPKTMPEEINRILTDRVSDFLFVPSPTGMANLKAENLLDRAYFTGDVMYDLFLEMREHFDRKLQKKHGLEGGNYVLCTLHRDFNVDDREVFEGILQGLQEIAQGTRVFWPLHPRAKKRLEEFGFQHYLDKIIVSDPVDYLELMGLLEDCRYVITDSGGFQKESYFAGKRALVLMPDTSWKELVEEGINLLVDGPGLLEASRQIKKEIPFKKGIYGGGQAAQQIMDILEDHLG